jgi:hypothetical protein
MFNDNVTNVQPKVSLMGGLIATESDVYHMGYTMQTYQSQNTDKEPMVEGVNTYKLQYNHPIHLVYAWGFDRSKVTNIKMEFKNSQGVWSTYFDGTMEELEYYKIHDVDAMVFYFSRDPFFAKSNSTMNFSRVNGARLVLTTDEKGERMINMGCISSLPIKYQCGMFGLQFC